MADFFALGLVFTVCSLALIGVVIVSERAKRRKAKDRGPQSPS